MGKGKGEPAFGWRESGQARFCLKVSGIGEEVAKRALFACGAQDADEMQINPSQTHGLDKGKQMKAQVYREMSTDELESKIQELQRHVFDLRSQATTEKAAGLPGGN